MCADVRAADLRALAAEASQANWLPAPEGPFTVIVRGYGGGAALQDGSYRLPPLARA